MGFLRSLQPFFQSSLYLPGVRHQQGYVQDYHRISMAEASLVVVYRIVALHVPPVL